MLRRPLRLVLRPVLLLLALAWLPWALLRVVNLEFVWVIPAIEGFAVYALLATLLVAVLALVLKLRIVALVAIVGLVALGYPHAELVRGNPQPTVAGPRLVVATANVRFGYGDAATLTRIVREQHVDVLALQENTADTTMAIQAAGLRTLLPYGVDNAQPGARGLSVYSRSPITATAPAVPAPGTADTRSIGGIIALAGGQQLQLRSVHPPPAVNQRSLRCWKHCTRGYPTPTSAAITTILAGDFNATLDHHPLRLLLDRGYRDAAEQAGAGWRPTWSNGAWAQLTLDHVLVPPGFAVRSVRTHDLPGSDHDVVVTTLRLPA